MLTYAQLKEALNKLTPEQLLLSVTLYDKESDEYIGVDYLTTTSTDTDVFDEIHTLLVFNDDITTD